MRILPWLLIAAAFVASAEVVIDNDQVRVLRVNEQPHQKTKLHDHKVNRVMIYLQPGTQTLDYQAGRTVTQHWNAGNVKWSPASGMHTAEITSSNPVTIVEVELKKPGDPAKSAAGPLDPVKLAPKMYQVLFENDQARVLRARIGTGRSTPLHEHKLNRVVVYISDQKLRVTTPDGKADIVEHKAGDITFSGPGKHTEENVNTAPFEVLVVELKD